MKPTVVLQHSKMYKRNEDNSPVNNTAKETEIVVYLGLRVEIQ